MSSKGILPSDYSEVLERIKTTVETAQIRTVVTVNRELVMLYWSIGQEILQRQDRRRYQSSYRRIYPRLRS